MIKASNLTKRYGKRLVVDNVSFEVATGKVTGFLGPNGAGKSTTMRLMLGLAGGKGTTTFDGKPLHTYNRPSEIVGILLEAKAFHPTRTARNHLRVLAAQGGISEKRVDEVLDIVGLKSQAKSKPGKFSLGMSQRLGIAAALLGQPKYLILDEPSNGLDPEGMAWLRDFLTQYADDGNAVFISSHLLSEMSQVADDIVVIGKGKMIANTSMRELIARNAKSSVFVRAANISKLEKLLGQNSLTYEKADDGLNVMGATTDKIGTLAFGAGVTVLELTNHGASLEDVFLDLTEGSEEFKAHDMAPKKGGKR